MHEKKLHIISMDNPFPPDFGGVIDVFFKIRALHGLGYKIYLHTFADPIPESCPELESITEAVFYYRFSTQPLLFFKTIPYSVATRNHASLLENLQKVDAPILFESLKTTYLVATGKLQNFRKILRLHNIEQDYFAGISKSENSWFRKFAFYVESLKFRRFEKLIPQFERVLALSHFEQEYISQKYQNASYVPVFHGNEKVTAMPGFGQYVLYHGDLNTADNREAVRFLASVFKEIPQVKLVIASGSGADFVKKTISNQPNAGFVPLRDFEHLKALMAGAHINICWSFQQSGTKLKAINALFHGRFCLINDNITDDPNVKNLCVVANDKDELIAAVQSIMHQPFEGIQQREQVLKSHLDDHQNALLIDNILQNP